nr:hypothetical protein [Desulfobulbaceae bacterium]
MSSIDLAKITLNNTKNFLKEGKEEVYAMLKDPKVSDWQHISLQKNAFILKSIGASVPEITKALKEYPKKAKDISKNISLWDNEARNQLADLIGSKDSQKALEKAQLLEAQSGELENLKSELQQQISVFFETNRLIREALTLQALVPIAQACPDTKANLFTVGLETLSFMTAEIGGDPTQKCVDQLLLEANKLEARFTHIDMPKVPRLAEEVIFHHISLGVTTTKEITTFISGLKERLAGEINALERIKIALGGLYNLDSKDILPGLQVQASALGALITGLCQKRQLKDNTETIAGTLEYLNVYQLALKNKLLPSISEEVDIHSSKLNPTSLSAKKTKDFFVGAKGIIRSIKLMVTSLKGHESINEIELQVILETAITRCSVFYGKSSKDVKKLHEFIHGLVGNFNRPFPYDDIFELTKSTIAQYGTEIERHMYDYALPSELISLATISMPKTFGSLYKKIGEKKTAFKKANTGK